MYKQIKFFIKNIFRVFIETIIKIITIRDKKIIIMGLRTPKTPLNKISKDYFMHNTKYLFLKLSKINKDFKFVYLIDNEDMAKALKERDFKNIYSRKSIKGIYYALRAKYWLYDDSKNDVTNPVLSGGAICINLWHGIPLKKIGFDLIDNYNKLQRCIIRMLGLRSDYIVANSEYEKQIHKTAFGIKETQSILVGNPRLDIFFSNIEHSDLFMEEDFATIKNFKEQGKKIFIYTPTFRDTGKDISGWLKSDKLKQFLKDNNAILVCKLHFADKNSLDFELPDEFYKMNSNSDIYPVLKYSDALITDYSSIYFDYLLLDKPILYYPIDLEEYQEKCRGFYHSYEELTAGAKAYTEEELISAMLNVANNVDDFKEERKILRDKVFKYQDGLNCERIIEWIESLTK